MTITVAMRIQAILPPLRMKRIRPIAAASRYASVEIDRHASFEIRGDRLDIGGAGANTPRQHVARIVERPDGRHRIDHGATDEYDRCRTERTLERAFRRHSNAS